MDLDLATTEELIEALMKRYERVLFVGDRKKPGNTDTRVSLAHYQVKGTVIDGIGLAEYVKHQILQGTRNGTA
jgi:hypothetical protein